MSFASEMSSWFEEMSALAGTSIVHSGRTLAAVQDEQRGDDLLIPGAMQATVEGAVFLRRADFAATPPKPRDHITVAGAPARILTINGEPADPIVRITYGKL